MWMRGSVPFNPVNPYLVGSPHYHILLFHCVHCILHGFDFFALKMSPPPHSHIVTASCVLHGFHLFALLMSPPYSHIVTASCTLHGFDLFVLNNCFIHYMAYIGCVGNLFIKNPPPLNVNCNTQNHYYQNKSFPTKT